MSEEALENDSVRPVGVLVESIVADFSERGLPDKGMRATLLVSPRRSLLDSHSTEREAVAAGNSGRS
jgi:hypothetical protein